MTRIESGSQVITDDGPELAAARERVEQTTRTARRTRIAAGDALRARARRRSVAFRIAMTAVTVLVVGALVLSAVLVLHNRFTDQRFAAADGALDASREAVAALLTADPADPEGYVDRALAVTTGSQHDRIADTRDVLMEVVSAQSAPSTGRVLSAGLVTDPSSDSDGVQARALVVADASDPQLIGAQEAVNRVTVEVTLIRVGARWLISRAVLT